ncbi:unnamed protein product [Symbiodinium pilosum]|uniref:Rab-GAP TBC domain-containing protein n=1 Tax=Symbiodinium pilosum TaxID=2952 RepID=A0A812L8L9_SYMPI|nr:unnamed protein product [Symbiodinium pilosum]
MACGSDAGSGRLSCSAADRKGPAPARSVRALDWPLSKEEKRHCAMKLFQKEVEASAEQLDDQSDQIDELQAEIKAGAPQGAAAVVHLLHGSWLPAELRQEGPVEATLLAAVEAYDTACQRSRSQPNRSPWRGLQDVTRREQIAKFYGGCEEHAADFWGCVAEKDGLTPLEAAMWLAKSLPAPVVMDGRWRGALLRNNQGRPGFEKMRARAQAADQAAVLRLEAERELRRAFRGDEFLETPGLSEAIVNISQTMSGPSGEHVPGATHVAALLLYGLLPGSTSLEEAEADAFWCFFELQTNSKPPSTDRRAKRLKELLRTYDEPLSETLNRQGLIFVAARLGEALFASGGFAVETCAQLWDAMLDDSERFAFSDWILCAMILLKRFQLLRMTDDAAQLAEALQSLPRTVPVERILRFAAALRAASRRRQRREAKASRARVRSPQEEPDEDVQGPLQVLGSWFGRAKEKGAEALEATRSVARCAWPRERCCRATPEPVEKCHEEEMQPLRRRNTAESSKTD